MGHGQPSGLPMVYSGLSLVHEILAAVVTVMVGFLADEEVEEQEEEAGYGEWPLSEIQRHDEHYSPEHYIPALLSYDVLRPYPTCLCA